MWTLPILLLAVTILLSIPLSAYFAMIMDGRYKAPAPLAWFEAKVNSGQQNWKQYVVAMLAFTLVLFTYGYVVLCLQPIAPLNPLGRGILGPSVIFNTVISFMTNTNLQHYSGDQHLSNFSQIFFILPNMFLSASIGFCALAAIIRAFRGEGTVGNFFLDMWRVMVCDKWNCADQPTRRGRLAVGIIMQPRPRRRRWPRPIGNYSRPANRSRPPPLRSRTGPAPSWTAWFVATAPWWQRRQA